MKHILQPAIILLVMSALAEAGSERQVRGRVVDQNGKPAADIDVTAHWRANGSPRDANGEPYDLKTVEAQKAYWGNVGQMYPMGQNPVKTGRDGRFEISIPDNRHHLMAMDQVRRSGALAILSADEAVEVELRLAPLTRVKGTMAGPGPEEKPEWCHVWALVPDEPTRPLDFTRLAGCGSFEARFEFWLPPGRYILNVRTMRGDDADEQEAAITPDPEILVTGKDAEIDLGIRRFPPFQLTLGATKVRSKAAGNWDDYTQHYGQAPPHWHVTDARGVKKDVQAGDYRGKWLLVGFWGLTCTPCLRREMPKLIEFYESHLAQRDQFEILALCIDVDGEVQSIAELDKKLQPIVKHVWGKQLPFPVLLDPSFKTWERYGLPGLGTVILIDPEGRLVEGDETVLAERLRKP